MTARTITVMTAMTAIMLGACGGDDSSANGQGSNGGTSSMQMDASTNQPPSIPRRDAQVTDTMDPITSCDVEDPSSCPSGEVCDVLLRRAAGAADFTAEMGCVTPGRERAEGDPCDLDPTDDGEPYMAPGVTDIIYREPCGSGLICAPNPRVRGAYACQRLCSNATACEDPGSICVRGPILPYCRKTEGCDVEKQTGCREGEACYMIPSDDGKQLLSLCAPHPDTATPDGMPGCSTTSCNPGSVCLGPIRMPISSWSDTNVMCRRVCNGEMGVAPETSDEDAGVPVGLCSETTRCEPFSASGLLLSTISAPPFGQCE